MFCLRVPFEGLRSSEQDFEGLWVSRARPGNKLLRLHLFGPGQFRLAPEDSNTKKSPKLDVRRVEQ